MIIEIHYQGCPVGEVEFDGDLNLSDFNFSARLESKMNSERFKAVDKQSFVRPKAEYSNTTEMQKELQNIN